MDLSELTRDLTFTEMDVVELDQPTLEETLELEGQDNAVNDI